MPVSPNVVKHNELVKNHNMQPEVQVDTRHQRTARTTQDRHNTGQLGQRRRDRTTQDN